MLFPIFADRLGLGRNEDALVAAIAANVKAKSELGSKDKASQNSRVKTTKRAQHFCETNREARSITLLEPCHQIKAWSMQKERAIILRCLIPPNPMRSIKGVVKPQITLLYQMLHYMQQAQYGQMNEAKT